jgi:hypothetical protein
MKFEQRKQFVLVLAEVTKSLIGEAAKRRDSAHFDKDSSFLVLNKF